MKKLLKKLLIKLLILFGKNDSDSFALMYHDISKKSKLKPEFFEYQLKYYLKKGYIFTSKVKELKKHKRILLTFDDAYASFKTEVVPILNKFKIPCILFVPTKYLGKKLEDDISKNKNREKEVISKESLIKLSKNKLITIGSHTHTHSDFLNKSKEETLKDLLKSTKIIEKITNKKCESFCYPQGKVNKKFADIVKKAGFKYAFTIRGRSFKHCKSYLKIPRYSGSYLSSRLFLRLSRNSNCNTYMKLNSY